MRTIFIELIFACSVPLILRYPIIGILVYYWASIMNPHLVMWAGTGIPWTMVVAVTTLFAWMFSRDSKKIPPGAAFPDLASRCIISLEWR